MKALLASTAILLALSAPPASAQQAEQSRSEVAAQPRASASAGKTPAGKAQDDVAQRRKNTLTVTSADHLVGDKLRDVAGKPAGEIEYVMIDTDTGKLEYLIVGSSDEFDLGGQLAAVPWSKAAITPRTPDIVNLSVGVDQLRKSPRFSSDRLFELTQPATVSQVTNFYVVPESGSTQQPDAAPSGKSSQQKPAKAGETGGVNLAGGKAAARNDVAPAKKQETNAAILVGRGVTTLLAPPLFKTADEIRGTEVELASGDDIGEVDKLIIDADNGRVAYLLLAKGGFLGLGEEWVPVPFESLRFDPAEPRFVLAVDESRLTQMPVLQKEEEALPATVSKRHLKMLYDHFGVQPYWQG